MDGDPWFWTVGQVSDFFRYRAHMYTNELPNGRLPDLPPFLRVLTLNDVSGAVLLTVVDNDFLRDDCKLTSLIVRTTIIHCIRKLRDQSAFRNGHDSIQTVPQSTPIAALPEIPMGYDGQQGANFAQLVPGQIVRGEEQQVEDAHGRKRRRLELPTSDHARPTPPMRLNPTLSGYLSDSALPIDEVFFGKTLPGHEIDVLEPEGETLVLEDDRDRSEDNFQFQAQHRASGERHYVWSQIRHFLCNENQIELQRSGRLALAVLPYQDSLVIKNKPRSAIVFQVNDDNSGIVAVRENAAFLDIKHDYNDLTQASTSGEWDFLLAKYKGSEELPAYGASLEEDIPPSLAEELDVEEEERTRAPRGILTSAQVSELIDEAIHGFIDEWKEKRLPRLEEKQAWRIWKQMKRSRTMRNILMEDATVKIMHLERRMEKYKTNFRLDEWRSERELRATCEILRATAEDREEFAWKKNVWARKKEPDHQCGHRKGAVSKTVARTSTSDFTVRPDDRIDVSPRDNASPPVENSEDDAETRSRDQYLFDTGVSFVVDPGDGTRPHDAIHMDPEAVGGHQHAYPEPTEDATFRNGTMRSSPPVPNHDGLSEAESLSRPEQDDSDPDYLPQMPILPSGLMRSRNKSVEQTRSRSLLSQELGNETIDLTNLSSDSSSPLGKFPMNQPQAKANYGINPKEASWAEVKMWDIHELAKRQDRARLLTKLLQSVGPGIRESLFDYYRKVRRKEFRAILLGTLRNMEGHDHVSESFNPVPASVNDPEQRNAMKRLAEIAVTWLLCDPDLIKRPLDTSEWACVSENEDQFTNFVDQTASYLRKRDGNHPHGPKRPSVASNPEDYPDNVTSDMTPHKMRKRHVKTSKTAQDARTQALQRQEKFKSAMESQSSNSQQLAAMVEADPSKSEIVINLTMKADQEPIYVHPNIAQKIKAHQIDGVRFMWREITNDGDDGEQGCILAHTMGLGKTMQTITLLTAVNEAALSRSPAISEQLPARLRPKGIHDKRQLRMLILSPPALLHNWRCEIDAWVVLALGNVFLVESALSNQRRMDELEAWHRLGGILLLSYDLFRAYIQNPLKPEERGRIDQILLHDPELVVADEVHVLKNHDSKMARAASKLRTHSRIGLTGTPMSNDVQEIYALISFVAPGYLGEPNEFRAHFTEPIKQGTYGDSTSHEIRVSRKKLEVLRLEIEPKVNRANITALRGSLKPKVEFVVTLPLTPIQQSIYDTVIDLVTEADRQSERSNTTVFSWLANLSVLTNHPIAFRRKLLTPSKGLTKHPKSPESPEVPASKSPTDATRNTVVHLNDVEDTVTDSADSAYEIGADKVFSEEAIKRLTAAIPDDPDPKLSAKVSVFFNILSLSSQCGDKVLAFSSSIPTLDYLSGLLEVSGIQFFRIDGKVQTGKRLALVEEFNNSAVSIMLISTKAGGTGLNIQAANRVVIFDFGFNPAWEEQAIGRVYRLGQKKPVYVYRFVTGGTFEDKVYDRQLFKQGLTLRVVDKQNPRRSVTRDVREFIYKSREIEQQDLNHWVGKDAKVLDQIVLRFQQERPVIRALSTMETLQEDAGDMPLTEEDWKDINEHRVIIASSRVKGKRPVQTTPAGLAMPPIPIAPSTAPPAGASTSTSAPAQSGGSHLFSDAF